MLQMKNEDRKLGQLSQIANRILEVVKNLISKISAQHSLCLTATFSLNYIINLNGIYPKMV